MKKITYSEWDSLSKIHRLNLINSCTGYKSANLIGTKSPNGIPNVAVFSSVTHLGSSPALLGFILRPNVVPRNTYNNIKAT
ncbi:MAG: flavin oxidoreductase, partial [Flavobacterium sp.]